MGSHCGVAFGVGVGSDVRDPTVPTIPTGSGIVVPVPVSQPAGLGLNQGSNPWVGSTMEWSLGFSNGYVRSLRKAIERGLFHLHSMVGSSAIQFFGKWSVPSHDNGKLRRGESLMGEADGLLGQWDERAKPGQSDRCTNRQQARCRKSDNPGQDKPDYKRSNMFPASSTNSC